MQQFAARAADAENAPAGQAGKAQLQGAKGLLAQPSGRRCGGGRGRGAARGRRAKRLGAAHLHSPARALPPTHAPDAGLWVISATWWAGSTRR